jgi:hypothetical protein
MVCSSDLQLQEPIEVRAAGSWRYGPVLR